MTTTQYLKVNLPQILINWTKDFIRADYSDMSAYVSVKSIEYATAQGIDKDMTRQQVLERIRIAFLSPVKLLAPYKRYQQSIKQCAGVIPEINEAIKYYNKF